MDLSDVQDSFDNHLFKVACQDVARIVSVLSLEAADVSKPRKLQSHKTYVHEKMIFFFRFLYLVFIKGFTPTVFDILPYRVWQILTIVIYIYRMIVLPYWLRLTGYGTHASWKFPPIGSLQPPLTDKFHSTDISFTLRRRLSIVDFGDKDYEKLIESLYHKTAHLSPHSRSPGNPFFYSGFPGNFLDHLLGVYKALKCWQQPEYVARAGLFHSVYGTYDYRSGFFDLRNGRGELQKLIGEAAEELAFVICTSDRIGLMQDLLPAMYGSEHSKELMNMSMSLTSTSYTKKPKFMQCTSPRVGHDQQEFEAVHGGGGNPYPPLTGVLSSQGFPVRNHITQEKHVLSADLFAQFMVVFAADFMEQGALGLGSSDADICLFQFLRLRFFSDTIQFVKPYLRVVPPVWDDFNTAVHAGLTEPTREQVKLLKRIWETKVKHIDYTALQGSDDMVVPTVAATDADNNKGTMALLELSFEEQHALLTIIQQYPYLPEPYVALAASMTADEVISGLMRHHYCARARKAVESWGMLIIKKGASIKQALLVIEHCCCRRPCAQQGEDHDHAGDGREDH